MSDALLVGNFQPNYCVEWEGTCPYLGAFVIYPGYSGFGDVCMNCRMTISCVRIDLSMKAKKFMETSKNEHSSNNQKL